MCLAIACMTALQLTLGSMHSVERDEATGGDHWCQFNPGLLLQSGNVLAGGYRSSLCRPIYLLGWRQSLWHNDWADAGILGALDRGYPWPVVLAANLRLWQRVEIYLSPMTDDRSNRLDAFVLGFAWRMEL